MWGAARNSVTFDENFHLPSGVLIAARHDYGVSPVNPPLVKALFAIPPLALGARLPDPALVRTGDQGLVGESFMRRNWAHYHSLFLAARAVTALLSVLLGLLIWRVARSLYGTRAGLLALGFYAFSPESLAHGGLATLDVATGLVLFAALVALWRFVRTGRWREWGWLALMVGLAFLTRFSTLLLVPVFLVLATLATLRRRARRPGRLWVGLALLIPTTLVMLQLGYAGRTSGVPLEVWNFQSRPFLALRHVLPHLRLPLPDYYIAGLDHQGYESQLGNTPTYLLGRERSGHVWYYFPLAALFKWPLGFLGAIVMRGALTPRLRPALRRRLGEACLGVGMLVFAGAAMFGVNLNAGVRYLFPILPLLCVWLGALAGVGPPTAQAVAGHAPGARRWRWIAVLGAVLVTLQAVESLAAAPWYLSFFNRFAGGPGGGDRLVNDSNVDWGQGLIALREEMRRRGIERIHLTYHGTADPAVYGIEYTPYVNGTPGPESDWLAVSSYYFVGLGQRMMTSEGRTPTLRVHFEPLWSTPWAARPAGCMYLFRIRP